ncbi:MAG: hypothetical protein IJF07_03380 [Lachnospiraceae bacterium]|nr:hypothetical protein [Lachnospiraceae bacterium]
METVLFVFVGALCLMMGVRVFFAEEQNRIFTKYPIRVTDVKKYNRLCGALIIGFGIVAEITIYFMVYTDGIVSTLCTLGIIVEALIVVGIYRLIEKKLVQKR